MRRRSAIVALVGAPPLREAGLRAIPLMVMVRIWRRRMAAHLSRIVAHSPLGLRGRATGSGGRHRASCIVASSAGSRNGRCNAAHRSSASFVAKNAPRLVRHLLRSLLHGPRRHSGRRNAKSRHLGLSLVRGGWCTARDSSSIMAARSREGPCHGSLGVWNGRSNAMIVISRHPHRSLLAHIDALELCQGRGNWVCRLSLLKRLLWLLSSSIGRRNRKNILSNTKSQARIGINGLWASRPLLQQIPGLRFIISIGLRSAHRTRRSLRLRRMPSVSVARLGIAGGRCGGGSLQIFGALASKRTVVLEESTPLLEHPLVWA